jgi:diaminopimelate epimerase
MKSMIPFTKMHGAGNDFIIIDNRKNHIKPGENSLIKKLCNRHLGIGADGLMLIHYKNPVHFRITYFNADGQPAEMCGNGARCAIFFMQLVQPEITDFVFKVGDVEYSGFVTGINSVRVIWNEAPQIINRAGLGEIITPDFERFAFVNSGVPHLVLQIKDNLDKIDIRTWGPYYRQHVFFQPAGTNVDFVEIADNKIHIRTFERGVEDETLSCGTGALAAAAAALDWGYLKLPVQIITNGGTLQVGLNENDKYWLEGPVQKVFEGKFSKSDFH